MRRHVGAFAILLLAISAASVDADEPADPAWLRETPLPADIVRARFADVPGTIVAPEGTRSSVVGSARDELARGLESLLGRRVTVATDPPRNGALLVGTLAALEPLLPGLEMPTDLPPESYWLKQVEGHGATRLVVAGSDERGVLYGAFALLRRIALRQPIAGLDERRGPRMPLRWTDEWNNLDGSIERGYAGPSIFFEHGAVAADLTRAGQYARLLASVGINGCAVNNVNADTRVVTPEFLPQLAGLAAAFRPWGVRLAVSIDFASPKTVGGLDTFDPLDPRVAEWWRAKVDEIYRAVPDLGGFVLKADSEGRVGPAAYGRTHADAANVIARALAPHEGVIFYRGFVYDHHMDWRNPKNDRARAAYDNFHPLDGLFDGNVLVQIKHGPIDFQAREPASPLFGALEKTNQAIELQVTQEYTGQQRHLCFLVPMWKGVLDFDMQAAPGGATVKDIVAGRTFKRPTGGMVAVSNVGRDPYWLGHPLAMANLYGFGRLAWDPDLTSAQIADEWTRLTFGHDDQVVSTVTSLLLRSWPTYEAYTGPLGAQTLTDILGPHYGPGIESSERNGWGQWHRADHDGIGMDRTVATGTGYVGQYRPPVAAGYESLADCPDELLLFMHHVPYTHVLHSGKTVIQHIYDAHYDGAAEAARFPDEWRALRARVDDARFDVVLRRLEYQAGHARVWRDAICSWFLRTSGIPDAKDRAGSFPGRVEAEAMTLEGYVVRDVTPWETASGGKAVVCAAPDGRCAASFAYAGPVGPQDVTIEYFDEKGGASRFRLLVGDAAVGEWRADSDFPSAEPNGHTSTRRLLRGLLLHPGDRIRIEGVSDGSEPAPLDYVEFEPSHTADARIGARSLVPSILHDQAAVFGAPLEVFRGRHVGAALGFLAGAGIAIALDPKDTPYFRRTQSFAGFNDTFGGGRTAVATAAAPAALYLTGLLRGEDRLRRTGLLAYEAAADAEILQFVVKAMSRRLRPSDIPPDGDFAHTFYKFRGSPFDPNTAFPSGHAIAAFAVASAIAERHRTPGWVPWAAYAVATAIGFSRVTLQSHFPSDVFAGAFLGIAIGRHVAHQP